MRRRNAPGWMVLICCLSAAALPGGPSAQNPPPREETIRKLADPQIDRRIEAAKLLSRHGPAEPDLFVPLVDAARVEQPLGDEKLGELMEYLADALSRIGEPAVAQLGRTLRDRDPRVRLLSSTTLIHLRLVDKVIVPVPVLIESLRAILALKEFDEESLFDFAGYAANGLAEIDPPLPPAPFIQVLGSDPDWRLRLIAILSLRNEDCLNDAVLAFIQSLGDGFRMDPPLEAGDQGELFAYPVREMALGLLKECSYSLQDRGLIPQGQELLLKNLYSEDQDLRLRSICLLGEFKISAAAEPLFRALRDPDPQIRSKTADALESLEDPRAVQPLIALLSDPEARLRSQAAKILLEFESRAADEPLIARLEDEDAQVRQSALPVLGRLDSSRALHLLAPLLNDADPDVRSAAVRQLARFQQTQGVLEMLLAAADDPWPLVRLNALSGLGKNGGRRAAARVLKALSDPDAQVRRRAVQVLGSWHGWKEPRLLDGVIQALTDSDPAVRKAAFEVVERFRLRRAAGQLAQCFKISDAGLRYEISKLLVKLGGPLEWRVMAELVITRHEGADRAIWVLGRVYYRQALPDLREALEDEDPGLRRAAAEALGRMRDQPSIGSLAARLQDPVAAVRSSAATGLGLYRSPALSDLLLKALADPDQSVRLAAAESLGKLQESRAIPRIADLIGESERPDDTRLAVALLKFFPQPESVPVLIEALGHRNWWVREQACKTLVEIARPQLIEALAPLLQDWEAGDDSAASRAVKTLSERGYGKEIEKWRRWREQARKNP